MKTLAAIRTHKWGEDQQRVLEDLRDAFGDNVVVVFQNRPADLELDVEVVDISDAWVQTSGLRRIYDWGWRCGDYFYYALRQAKPDYDFYWLVEPDVYFDGDAADFFDNFTNVDADLMGYQLGPFPRDIPFTRGLPGMEHHRAIYALTRFSGRALDRLFELRKVYSTNGVRPRFFTNDEVFTFSHGIADPELTHGRLEDHALGWFDGQFETDPDLLISTIPTLSDGAGRVYHPVRSLASFKEALAQRLASHTGFLHEMKGSLQELSPDDINDVADLASAKLRAVLGATK